MAPEEFLELVPSTIFSEEILNDLKRKMKKRIPLDPLFLDVNEEGEILRHEGRHRAESARLLGVTKIPILLYCRNRGGDFLPIERCKFKQLKPEKPFSFKDWLNPIFS